MKMSEGGRVVVPIEIRKALNLNEGDTVCWDLVDGGARLTSKLERLRLVQNRVQVESGLAKQTSVVDELIAERRSEAARE